MSLQTPKSVRRLQRKLYEKAKQDPDYRFYLLYDKVWRGDNLDHAYRLSRSNGGSPGVDGETFAQIEAGGVEKWLKGLQDELRTQTYRPQPVKRVMIPKAGGGERPLGIPTIRDRVAQQAAKLVLEPIFEAGFDDGAYGYRPKRSARDAVREVHRTLCQGYTDVVDADLSKYFDTIPHRELMQSVSRRVVDRKLLALVRQWLKVAVEETDGEGRRRLSGGKASTRGTPQGGVISPLLANVYMHRYLKAWRLHGKAEEYRARIINYADDFVILSRGHAAEALEWTRRVMERIGLTLNESKTCLRDARKESFNFLGYTFGAMIYKRQGTRYLGAKPSERSVERFKERIGEILNRKNQAPWEEVVRHLIPPMRGWATYFSYGSRGETFRRLERYIEDLVRGFLTRRHKETVQGFGRYSGRVIFGELGVPRLDALVAKLA